MLYSVVPSFPAPSWSELERVLCALSGHVAGFQVDLVDGQFATPPSWPFVTANGVSALPEVLPFATMYELEADCMLREPLQYLDALVAAGFARIVVHFGSTDSWEAIFAHRETHGYRLGLAFTNDHIDEAISLIPHFSYVQVMGIATVGAQGQPFDERTLTSVAMLREAYPELTIAIDGSVNVSTIPRLLAAGANRFAPGSAITRATDPLTAYKQLVALLP